MFIDTKYAYFLLTIPFLIVWILLFIFTKTTRKEQLEASFLGLPIGIITEIFYFQDYWNPQSVFQLSVGPIRILLEDFLFSFAIFGIAAIVYKAVFNKQCVAIEKSMHRANTFDIFSVVLLGVGISLALFFSGLNSIFATSGGFLAIALFVVAKRRDLISQSLFGGFSVMMLMFVIYCVGFRYVANSERILQEIWFLYGTPLDIRFLGVPATEMIWGFAFGTWVGPLYLFLKGFRFEAQKSV